MLRKGGSPIVLLRHRWNPLCRVRIARREWREASGAKVLEPAAEGVVLPYVRPRKAADS